MRKLLVLFALILSFNISAQPIEITCPNDVVQGTDPGVCTAIVNGLTPEINADNPIAALIWTLEGVNTSDQSDLCGINDVSGYNFVGNLSGLTTVTYTVIDIFANAATCTFEVDINDTEAPQFTVPDPCNTDLFPGSIDCIFPSYDDVPPLWGPPYPDVADIVFETLSDNCLSADVAPWYGPTLTSGVLDMGDTWVTYTFTANDDEWNTNTQDMTFNWDIGLHVPEYNLGDLRVFPNPSNGVFFCSEKYKVYTLGGVEVFRPFNPGMYILKGESNRVTPIIIY